MILNRREFLKTSYRTGMAAILIRYLSPENVFSATLPGQAALTSQNLAGKQLYEGRVKATGGKIYVIDFRAKDMPGWPSIERRGVILRSSRVDLVYKGLDLDQMRQQYMGFKLVTAEDLNRWGCRGAAPFLMPEFYVTPGTSLAYFGQPLALLSFKSTDDFLAVKSKIPELKRYVQYQGTVPEVRRQDYGTSQFVFYQGKTQEPEFSFMKNLPELDTLDAGSAKDKYQARSAHYIKQIQQDLDQADWHRIQSRYETQSVDPMFLEPENGLSWYDSKSQTLSLVLGTQSPHEDAVAIDEFFSKANTPPIKHIIIHCCFLGGGFGGKDSSDFPLHLAIAAMAEPDVSHRIVHTRADQFQGGLKRHSSQTDISLAVDANGNFQYLKSVMTLDGGGQNNYSFAIQSVGARNAAGAYHFPRSQIDAVAHATKNIPAGSMRGFGSFQSCFALECLIDEAAQTIQMDPIALRLKNCPLGNVYTQTGVQLVIPNHAQKVLTAASQSALWRNRSVIKKERLSPDTLYGTGFAAASKTFGKHENGCLAGVELSQEGVIKLYIPSVDMGNGSATTLSLSLATIFGRPADEVEIGVTHYFDALKLISTAAKSEEEQGVLSLNPFWTPSLVISSAASTSAYHLRHTVLEAARVIWNFGLLPAAQQLLGLRGAEAPLNAQDYTLDAHGLKYKNGQVFSFAQLAASAHQYGFVTGTLVHAYYRESWAEAAFIISDKKYKSEIDALSVRNGSKEYVAVPRTHVKYSSLRSLEGDANRMSSYAIIVSVTVNRSTGEVRIVDAETFLDSGPPIQREIVEGQMQGAFAMGIGQTLTENLSPANQPAGQGELNLHLYQLPLSKDCAVGTAKFNILEASVGDEPRGISEVVFNPVSAAIVNALADATQHRFNTLPISQADVKKVLSK
jgi:CO/xanthine dehydrogenase Mo-binding subunit